MANRSTDKQKRFVDEYLKCWNATEAARRAGYSKRTAHAIGWENLRKPEIKAAIDSHLAENHLSADEVLALLSDIAHSDIREFVKVDRLGRPYAFDLSSSKPLHLVKKIAITDKGGITIELYDALAALVKLGEYHKLFIHQIEVKDWREAAKQAGLNPDEVLSDFECVVIAKMGARASDSRGDTESIESGGTDKPMGEASST